MPDGEFQEFVRPLVADAQLKLQDARDALSFLRCRLVEEGYDREHFGVGEYLDAQHGFDAVATYLKEMLPDER